MNNEAYQRALEVLRSKDFQAEFAAELRAKRDAREAFAKSDTFNRMLEAFKGQCEHLVVDSEEVSYFPDKVRTTAGWEFATKEDIDQFFDVVSDSGADTVEAGSVTEDEDCPFDNSQFRHFGLTVYRMSGQGTIITIHNR